jgi:hypothetical protein
VPTTAQLERRAERIYKKRAFKRKQTCKQSKFQVEPISSNTKKKKLQYISKICFYNKTFGSMRSISRSVIKNLNVILFAAISFVASGKKIPIPRFY